MDPFILKCMSWNIEGFKRNSYNLKHFCDNFHQDLICISEPKLLQCDLGLLSKPFVGQYSFLLNSEETTSPDLPLSTSRAHGGTLMMWKSSLGPYIESLPITAPAFLPILLRVPGYMNMPLQYTSLFISPQLAEMLILLELSPSLMHS